MADRRWRMFFSKISTIFVQNWYLGVFEVADYESATCYNSVQIKKNYIDGVVYYLVRFDIIRFEISDLETFSRYKRLKHRTIWCVVKQHMKIWVKSEDTDLHTLCMYVQTAYLFLQWLLQRANVSPRCRQAESSEICVFLRCTIVRTLYYFTTES